MENNKAALKGGVSNPGFLMNMPKQFSTTQSRELRLLKRS